ncbi:hypothetical protein CEUSTIGMA_g10737.t1, partial [Chlamydomonas eustigma]
EEEEEEEEEEEDEEEEEEDEEEEEEDEEEEEEDEEEEEEEDEEEKEEDEEEEEEEDDEEEDDEEEDDEEEEDEEEEDEEDDKVRFGPDYFEDLDLSRSFSRNGRRTNKHHKYLVCAESNIDAMCTVQTLQTLVETLLGGEACYLWCVCDQEADLEDAASMLLMGSESGLWVHVAEALRLCFVTDDVSSLQTSGSITRQQIMTLLSNARARLKFSLAFKLLSINGGLAAHPYPVDPEDGPSPHDDPFVIRELRWSSKLIDLGVDRRVFASTGRSMSAKAKFFYLLVPPTTLSQPVASFQVSPKLSLVSGLETFVPHLSDNIQQTFQSIMSAGDDGLLMVRVGDVFWTKQTVLWNPNAIRLIRGKVVPGNPGDKMVAWFLDGSRKTWKSSTLTKFLPVANFINVYERFKRGTFVFGNISKGQDWRTEYATIEFSNSTARVHLTKPFITVLAAYHYAKSLLTHSKDMIVASSDTTDLDDLDFLKTYFEDDPIELTTNIPTNQFNDANQLSVRLKKADPGLFAYRAVRPENEKYASVCQSNRQPVVMTSDEPGSEMGIPYGSTKDLFNKNRYLCPDVWCPLSRVPLTTSEFVAKGSKCPGYSETPMVFKDLPIWADSDKRYIGFASSIKHPDGFCLPCCFRKPRPPNQCLDQTRRRLGLVSGNINPSVNNDQPRNAPPINRKYIIGWGTTMLDPGRLALLPEVISVALGNPAGMKPGGIDGNKKVYLCVGSPTDPIQPFLACVASILGCTLEALIEDLVEEASDPSFFDLLQLSTLSQTEYINRILTSSFVDPRLVGTQLSLRGILFFDADDSTSFRHPSNLSTVNIVVGSVYAHIYAKVCLATFSDLQKPSINEDLLTVDLPSKLQMPTLRSGKAYKGRDGSIVTDDLRVFGAAEPGVELLPESQSDNKRSVLTFNADCEILAVKDKKDTTRELFFGRQIVGDAELLRFVAMIRDPELPLPIRARRRVIRCRFPDFPGPLIKKLSSDLSKSLDELIDDLIPPIELSTSIEGFVRFRLEDKGEDELFEHLAMRLRSSSST